MKLAIMLAVGSVVSASLASFAQPVTAPQTQPTTAVAPREGPVMTTGRLDAVTVYRGQAMVTRVLTVPGGAGLHEVVVTDLPARVVPTSLFAESGAGVQVRSVLYRERAMIEDVREDVKALDEQIAAIQLKMVEVERYRQVLQQNAEYLTKLEAFTAATSNVELSKGVLNAETLQQLTNFIFSKRTELAKESLEAEAANGQMQKQLEVLARQRAQLTQGASRTAREAVLVIDVKEGAADVRLNYLVDQAGWQPSYTLNATSGKDDVSLLYQAAITQMSGEDWGDVKMTLSTATPSVVARAPKLEPLALALVRDDPSQPAMPDADAARGIQYRRAEQAKSYASNASSAAPNQQQQGQSGFAGGLAGPEGQIQVAQRENEQGANRLAGEAQMFELRSKDAAAARAVSRMDAETIIVTYQLDGRTSLPSRTDQQLVGIATLPVKAEFYKLAVPVLTPYVYNEAAIRNSSPQVLLAGPTVSYLNGEFVGHGELPTVAIGETFTAGFGIDHTLRAGRELVNKTEKQQGGNMISTFEYALRVENFGAAPATVRLMDRIPMADGAALKPTLASSSVPTSADPEYKAGPEKKGLLRFDIEVPAQAIGTKANEVKYTLTLEYDRQMTITAR